MKFLLEFAPGPVNSATMSAMKPATNPAIKSANSERARGVADFGHERSLEPLFPREERGIIIAAHYKLHNQNGVWLVPSQGGGEKHYDVDPTHGTCACPDFKEWGYKCKHLYAVDI